MGGRAFGGQHRFRVHTASLSHTQSILGTRGKASWGLLQFQLSEPLGRSHGVAQIHCNPPLVRSETGRWYEGPSSTCTLPQTPGQENKDLPAHVRHYSLLKSVTEASGPSEFGCVCGWVRLGGHGVCAYGCQASTAFHPPPGSSSISVLEGAAVLPAVLRAELPGV